MYQLQNGSGCVAFLSMAGFIILTGLALFYKYVGFWIQEKVKSGIVYSAVDIYFQPFSVSYRRSAGIGNVYDAGWNSGAVTTIVVLIKLDLIHNCDYVIGAVCFIFNFDMFRQFSIW